MATLTTMFFVQGLGLGAGLAADACSVSMTDGLNEPKMKWGKILGISGTFGLFQGVMPLIGWLCFHTLAQKFERFAAWVPWIAFALLAFIGGKMLFDGIRHKDGEEKNTKLNFGGILLQGLATSIDALSVGSTSAGYSFFEAFITSAIIAAVTFAFCVGGVLIGKRFGTRLANKAEFIGGAILIAVGLKVLIESFF